MYQTEHNPISAKYVTPIAQTAYAPSNSIQPFEILEVDQEGFRSDGRMQVPTDEGSELSMTTNTLVAISSRDGHKITHEEKHAAIRSTNTGLNLSEQIDRKVLLANYDTPIYQPSEFATKVTANPYHNASAPPIYQKDDRLELAPDGSPLKKTGGYVIPEYRSMYDDPTTSSMATTYEYKSMYDP